MNFTKLKHTKELKDGAKTDCFFFSSVKQFCRGGHLAEFIEKSFEFSYGMTFGNEGGHREHRSGGIIRRKKGELFCNTFQGKLAEYSIYDLFRSKNIEIDGPDLGMWERGIWDETDFEILGKKISVKSMAFFSNLLLLETADWDENGNYIPNKAAGKGTYDFFIAVRIKPDIKNIFKTNRLYYSDTADKQRLHGIISAERWEYDIPGYFTHDDLKEIIKNRNIISQGSFLNGKTRMDADNYYCQTGDLRSTDTLINTIKN